MKDKKDYSRFYISMIIILSILFATTTIYDAIEDKRHFEEDLNFANEIGDFIIYEAEIINYCANMSNLSNTELLTDFLKFKADEVINEFALEVEDE